MIWFDKNGYKVSAGINLTQKTFQCIGMVDDPNAASVPTTPQFSCPFPPHLTDKQMQQLKGLVAALPAKTSLASEWDNAEFKNQYHIAFYRGGILELCSYSKGDLPTEFVQLLTFLGVRNYYT